MLLSILARERQDKSLLQTLKDGTMTLSSVVNNRGLCWREISRMILYMGHGKRVKIKQRLTETGSSHHGEIDSMINAFSNVFTRYCQEQRQTATYETLAK